MNTRNRVTTAMVSTLAVAALLVPSVSEAAPAIPGLTPIERAASSLAALPPLPYYVYLDSFHISHTRALHNDTDSVHLAALAQPAGLGNIAGWGPQDVNDGDHSVGLVLGPYYLAPYDSATLAFSYIIMNLGFGVCDGVVAADSVALGGAVLANLTATGSYSETRNYPGTASALGCGANSNYNVTWHIAHDLPTGTAGGGSTGGVGHRVRQ